MESRKDGSFSILCKPGRLLMRKKRPTKRKFSFSSRRFHELPCLENKENIFPVANVPSPKKNINRGLHQNIKLSKTRNTAVTSPYHKMVQKKDKHVYMAKENTINIKKGGSILKVFKQKRLVNFRKLIYNDSSFLTITRDPPVHKLMKSFLTSSFDSVNRKLNGSVRKKLVEPLNFTICTDTYVRSQSNWNMEQDFCQKEINSKVHRNIADLKNVDISNMSKICDVTDFSYVTSAKENLKNRSTVILAKQNEKECKSGSSYVNDSLDQRKSDTVPQKEYFNVENDVREDTHLNLLLVSPMCAEDKSHDCYCDVSNLNSDSKKLFSYDETELGLKRKTSKSNNAPHDVNQSSSFILPKSYEECCENQQVTDDSQLLNDLLLDQSSCETSSAPMSNKPDKFPLSGKLQEKLKKRQNQKDFDVEIQPQVNRANVQLESKKNKKISTRTLSLSTEPLPEDIGVFMWKKSSLKRRITDVTDSEIAFTIMVNSLECMRKETSNPEVLLRLKQYKKGVVKDATHVISRCTELQAKNKEITMLYKELKDKSKRLGLLIDEKLKIRQSLLEKKQKTKSSLDEGAARISLRN